MAVARIALAIVVFSLVSAGAVFPRVLWADPISPAQEQEFSDARASLDAARKAQAEQFAPEPFKQAGDYLQRADKARQSQDAVTFTRASRLSRAYAELAKALAELHDEREKLAVTNKELEEIKAEIERLKKSP